MRRPFAAAAAAAVCAAPASAQLVSAGDESGDKSDDRGAAVQAWDYGDWARWAELSDDFSECGNALQSPIALQTAQAAMSEPAFMRLHYPRGSQNTELTVSNDGKELMLDLRNRGITLAGEEFPQHYQLTSLIYHVPAEHLIDGVRYPLERQMVFVATDKDAGGQSADTGLAAGSPGSALTHIFAEVYDVDASEGAGGDPLVQQLADSGALEKLSDGASTTVRHITTNFDFLDSPHFHYPGSLTTPPCSEKVNWRINTMIKKVTPQQLQPLADIVHLMYTSKSQGTPTPHPTTAYPGTQVQSNSWVDHQGTARPATPKNNRSLIVRQYYQYKCIPGLDTGVC